MAMCNDLFTCKLSQAAALAATMQGHAGLQGPAKALAKGQKVAGDVSALKTPLTGVSTSQKILSGL